MGKFASGKNAYAISDRSGFRYLYRDMKKEWNGLLVGPDEFETKQPQLGPFRTVSDAQALKDAGAEAISGIDIPGIVSGFFNSKKFSFLYRMHFQCLH